MNRLRYLFFYLLPLSFLSFAQSQWIRVNQIGYLEDDVKVAVWVSKSLTEISSFELVDAVDNKTVLLSDNIKTTGIQPAFESSARLNFSKFSKPGKYYIRVNGIESPIFAIGNEIYAGASEIPLQYMRQQRCGYNPYLKDSCHIHDGISVADPDSLRNGQYFNVTGGWHDASDYLQYVTTSANAVYQMLFAYTQYPYAFADNYQANGDEGSNGIPDILDEAKWGLDWLIKMNPDKYTYFNQLADDRDHGGFVLPPAQEVDYGWGAGKERPVYFVSPKPQGLFQHKNRSTGMASTLGKYTSAFALGATLLQDYYPEYAAMLIEKAGDAYQKAVENPGVSQTAPGRSPYFYEEDNWADDMELAAVQLYQSFKDPNFLKQAVDYGRLEPVTPWMGADSARHYQWYPFVNLGHFHLSKQTANQRISKEFIRNMRSGLQRVADRAEGNAFMHGIPFIWCSNNLTVAFITQCRLYHELTGDNQFLEIETAMRDWLFGVNPWGKCMIVGYPDNGDTPQDPHSAFTHLHQMPITGGIVDGPIYHAIYSNLIGVYLSKDDAYADFQSNMVVYHDDYADYSTNEPTMDGTASMSYYMAYLSSRAQQPTMVQGGIIRGDKTAKKIALMFTGHEFADGATTIQKVLKQHQIKASFFLTGDFYRKYPKIARKLEQDGHYMAPHSDQHLLLCDWNKRDSTLVSQDEFTNDLQNNYQAMEHAGLSIPTKKYYMPPYEWYNQKISDWSKNIGVQIVNFTPGTSSNADYTIPSMKNYVSSKEIYENIMAYEKAHNLNGFHLLLHIGTHPERKDKFYKHLDKLITELKGLGYEFSGIEAVLGITSSSPLD